MFRILVFIIALQTPSGNFVWLGYSDVGGQRWKAVVTAQAVAGAPSWDGTGAPPLTPGAAANAARLQLRRTTGAAADWVVESIALESVVAPSGWIYVVQFREPSNLRVMDQKPERMTVVVLMNGSPVEPVLTTDETRVPEVRPN
jgi:hypothetical protein